jgi:hypothetical protein
MVQKNPPFGVLSSDVRSVSSALQAADRSWKRGETGAVVRWLQRAADAATEAADDARAVELADCARELARQIASPHERPPDAKPSSPASSVHLLTKLAQPKSAAPPPPPSSGPSAFAEVSRSRAPTGFEEDTNQVAIFQLRDQAARARKEQVPPARPPSPSRPSVTEAETRAHIRDEWLIETVAGTDSAPDIYVPERPAAGRPPPSPRRAEPERRPPPAPPTAPTLPVRVPVSSTEAVRVLLWRDEDGALYVTTAGAPAPAHAVEAMLTALEPGVDLVALLEGPK